MLRKTTVCVYSAPLFHARLTVSVPPLYRPLSQEGCFTTNGVFYQKEGFWTRLFGNLPKRGFGPVYSVILPEMAVLPETAVFTGKWLFYQKWLYLQENGCFAGNSPEMAVLPGIHQKWLFYTRNGCFIPEMAVLYPEWLFIPAVVTLLTPAVVTL